jgi:hypothetical protein
MAWPPIATSLPLVAVALLGMCTSTSSVTDDHRAAAQAKLDAFGKIETDAKARPPVTSASFEELPDSLSLTSEGSFDTGVVLLDVLAKPCDKELRFGGDPEAPRVDLARLPTNPKLWFRNAACYLGNGAPPAGEREPEPEKLERWFGQLEGSKYLLVIRFHAYSEPKVLGDAVSASKFASGKISGDGLLYAVDGAKYLGGFPFAVDSSAETRTNPGGAIHSASDAVATDFRERTTLVIEEAITANMPGAKLR